MLSHKNLSVNVQQIQTWFPALEFGKDSMVATYPLFHSAGNIISCFIIWMGWEQILIPGGAQRIIEILNEQSRSGCPGCPRSSWGF